ncbi:MAG TPA: DUF928 domain-containing protein [Stellaceae bacterium]|nr:DUF928 domain-containing protein [Stellaceae bacterium]
MILVIASIPLSAQEAPPAPSPSASGAVYKPPLRGAPGGRVGGGSRSAVKSAAALPIIDVVAPADHTGETATATPTLYFYVSGPVPFPTQLTIAAPLRAAPVLEVTIASPPARGLYTLRLADYRAQLDPGIIYTWSVSAIVDAQHWSHNVVASATILRVTPTASDLAAKSPVARAAFLGDSGLWYDAVAAAFDAQSLDHRAALDELLAEVGLNEAVSVDRAVSGNAPAIR